MDRRSDEGRQAPGGGYPGADRREADRRVMVHGLLLSTARTVASIEEWLEPNCEGDWTIVLDGLDEEVLGKKRLRIMFELETDKQKFIAEFTR